ncbi:MAG: GTP-binding protein [Devosia sp.]|uniref:elongation factor G n=1 Tax=Devosia sp. TaxID=1871048 RepID=UPI002619EC64|nr:TetM/TetW/TetO/TetS family tetracycline resistance ribosomal protection protein [Devosia sp.]MDB5587705.1 GTP-binding protein [Devosia sp.]
MRTLNLGILAHVDAGKTSLIERLLFAAGVIDKIGSVDDGNTQTDTMALERQRGITIKAAVVSFVVGDVTVNLIDMPGHPDFIAEVERVLNVLDGAILVVSAVEGVQAQTRVLMRALQRLRIPTLIFVNKIDRRGAQSDGVLEAIKARLTPAVLAMGETASEGERDAEFRPFGANEADFRAALIECLSEGDDALLTDYVTDPAGVDATRLHDTLRAQSRTSIVHPVFFGSAVTGAGIEPLMAAIPELLHAEIGDDDGPVSASVFKIERGWAGDKIAYARMFSGTIHLRDRVLVNGRDSRVTAIQVFEGGKSNTAMTVGAGRIAKLSGLGDIRIGDTIGVPPPRQSSHHFAPPTLETSVLPAHAADRAALWLALSQLAEQDPLINLRKNDEAQQVFVSLYGEVQKQVIQQTLLAEFNIEIAFQESTVICVERLAGSGAAVEYLFKDPNPFLATVGLRVDPMPAGSGVSFALEVDPGQMPAGFYRAVEEAVRETLQQGIYGWRVMDCHVAMTDVRHASPMTTAGDFRNLTPLVLAEALRQAGTLVCEPIQRFHLEAPAATLGAILRILGRAGAVTESTEIGGTMARLEGEIQAAHVHGVQHQLPGLTSGEGIFETTFDHYRPVSSPIPTRPRSGPNPFDRQVYLHRVQRKLAVSSDEGD